VRAGLGYYFWIDGGDGTTGTPRWIINRLEG
jgi:hypothetical protein